MTHEKENAVTKEVAEQEISAWLDFKKISEEKRTANKESIKTLVDAICSGNILIDENKTITQVLKFPIESEISTSELKYKPRITVKNVQQNLKGVKGDDVDGRLMAYVVTLTGKVKGIIETLDTEDYSICTSIAVFFL